jgi:hypothetical protein
MIWEADVYLVVMLTGVQEEGSTVYCPGLAERCVDIGEVSFYCVQHYLWLAVSWVYHQLVLLSDFSLCLLSVGYHELFPGGKVARLRS